MNFWLVELKKEVHTEIRAFGNDYWFERDGSNQIKSRNKEKQPYKGSNYKLKGIIGSFSIRISVKYLIFQTADTQELLSKSSEIMFSWSGQFTGFYIQV